MRDGGFRPQYLGTAAGASSTYLTTPRPLRPPGFHPGVLEQRTRDMTELQFLRARLLLKLDGLTVACHYWPRVRRQGHRPETRVTIA